MARHEPTAKEIKQMSYQTRERMFNQEKDELFANASGMTTAEVSEALRKLADKWKV